MSRIDDYRSVLLQTVNWDAYLQQESRLPGPRGNLELAQAAAEEGDEAAFRRWLAFDSDKAPINTPLEFLAFCGTLGLGRLLGEGRHDLLPELRRLASDPRWRTREAVAMALQRLGDADMEALLREMEAWALGTPLEQRAAAAAICEPRLLRRPADVCRVLSILDAITSSVVSAGDRRSEAFRALRKGLGYCWSVAAAAHPDAGKQAIERWLACDDPDVRWIIRENLKKNRLDRMDAAWVETSRSRLQGAP
jgi:hypothetical protein